MGDGKGTRLQFFPRRGVVQLFGGEECSSLTETGLRAGAVGALAQEVLPGFEAPDVEVFVAHGSEGVEALAVGQEEVQAGVVAVLRDPGYGPPDAGQGVRSLPGVVAQEGEVPLGVGVAVEGCGTTGDDAKLGV